MNNIKIKPAEKFDQKLHILEKVGENYNLGTIYNEDGDNLHVFLVGSGRKQIAKADAHQVFVEEDGVDYFYNEGVEHLTHSVTFLQETKPTLDITGNETTEERDTKLKDYSDLLYPYLLKEKAAKDHILKIQGDSVTVDRTKVIDNKILGMFVENIGKQHLSLEQKGIQILKSLENKGYKLVHI